uniref:Putative Pentatricopeptide repeat (PPR) superfamily protein isoform 1 n=1 Tax=Davidia involucrata TaxID=16924 RepID=A0A5B7AUL3_DAVIN
MISKLSHGSAISTSLSANFLSLGSAIFFGNFPNSLSKLSHGFAISTSLSVNFLLLVPKFPLASWEFWQSLVISRRSSLSFDPSEPNTQLNLTPFPCTILLSNHFCEKIAWILYYGCLKI